MKNYNGSCHCRKVQFTFKSENILEGIYRCNCSLCRKKSLRMKAEHFSQFELVSGAENLRSYKWNKNIAEHFFCETCGVYTHHKRRRFPDHICVNVACLDDLEVPDDAPIALADGASHD